MTDRHPYLHRIIARQAAECNARGRPWHPSEYPELYGLIRAAVKDIRSRSRSRHRMAMTYRGRRYRVQATNIGRVTVHDWRTGDQLASSGYGAAW